MKDQEVLVVAAQKLKQHEIKATPQRQIILAYLMRSTEHPSINMIHQYLKKQDHKVSLATVYNTLELLAKHDLVVEVALDSAGHVRYDYFDQPHYHLICLNCGKIEDVFDDSYLALEKLAQKQSAYRIISSRYDVYGLCPECQAKE
ncbi:Fur family transcriptional regulator [Ligilactobacillus faecis]|uniref:Fur family transcriptional regulator n=1 Tax=Ligilactobacillus faecis TaxID=762833 RepID=UPI0024694A81|nr:transcriptional repressor [Ligilactobacillus faecis]WGN88716.1 transcriptional repressor [Ligilactobacillus faecis]